MGGARQQATWWWVSLPPKAYPAVPVQPLAGKPVLDTINYIPERDGSIPELYDGPLSSSEVLQRHLGTAQVVKVFNNITSWHLGSLARPAGTADRSALPLAGDDPAAKAAVTRFLDGIGYDAVDAGPLGSGGRRFQFGTPAFVLPYGGLGDERGTPAGVAAIPRRCAPVTPNPVPQIDASYRIPLAASAVCPSRSSHGFASKRSNTSRASCRSGGASSARPSRTSHSPCSRSVTAM